jgi:putative hydrolase of the HAD superfamily
MAEPEDLEIHASGRRRMIHSTDAVNAVLFDLDNTLIYSDVAFAAWANWFARERLGLVNDVEIEEEVAVIVRRDVDGYASREARLQELRERHSILTESLEALMAAFRGQLLAVLPPLDDDAAQLLAALDDVAVPWGIVSNGAPSQLDKIRKLDLITRASCVLVSEIVGIQKPDPEFFLAAVQQIGVAPYEILFIGDHPTADIGGASGAGMQTAWVRRGREWPRAETDSPPDYIIESLAELMWIVESRS